MQLIKPRNPIINWGNPLTKNLTLVTSLSAGGGTNEVDLIRKITGTLTNSPTWKNNQMGMGLSFVAASNQYVTFGEPTGFPPNRGFTMFSLFRPADAASTYAIFGFANGGPLYRYNSSSKIDFLRSQVVGIITSTGTLTAGLFHTVAVTVDNAATANCVLYMDGHQDSTGTTTQTFNYFDMPTNSRLIIGGDWSSVLQNPFNGDISLNLIWNRILTAKEIAMLNADPFQIFKRPGLVGNQIGF